MRRVIPLVLDDDVPEAILGWIAKANLRDLDVLQKKEGALEELLHSRRIREQFFWSLACQSSFEGLVAQLFKAFPEDPWVQALHDEVHSSTAQIGGDASGLVGLLQSGEVAEYVKPKKLQVLLDEIHKQNEGQSHFEQMAVALLLEHKGLIDEEEREELLAHWASKPDEA